MNNLRKYFLGILAWLVLRLLIASWQISIFEPESFKALIKKREPMVFAHWHGDELALILFFTKYRIATITSKSRDGEIMDLAVRLLGGRTSRGSSSRDAVSALKGLVRIVRQDRRNSSFAVDGPKGPIYQIKPGVFEVSRLLNAPIYCVGVATDRSKKFERSWNKTYFPLPFAKVAFHWAGPMGPITKEMDPRSPGLALELANGLRSAQAVAAASLID